MGLVGAGQQLAEANSDRMVKSKEKAGILVATNRIYTANKVTGCSLNEICSFPYENYLQLKK